MTKDTTLVEDKVVELSETLCRQLEPAFCDVPALQLDYTWPTIGVMDLLSFPFRKKPGMSDSEKHLFVMISAYIGIVISRAWKEAGIGHRVYFDELKGGVCISFPGGNEAGSKDLLLTNFLTDFFVAMPAELPVFRNFYRPYHFEGNVLSGICLGIATGLSPAGEFPWTQKLTKDSTPTSKKEIHDSTIIHIERALAVQCATWFSGRYPDVMMAQVPDLFMHGVILPPLFYDEKEGVNDSLDPLIEYLQETRVPSEMIRQLACVFAGCPDEKISFLGVLLGMYIYPTYEALPVVIKLACKHYRSLIPSARNTILSYKAPEVSPQYLLEKPDGRYFALFEFEKSAGTLPWLSLTAEDLYGKREFAIDKFLRAVLGFEYDKAYAELNEIVVSFPADIGLRIQHIAFEMLRGDFAHAHDLAKVLVSEPEAEKRPDFYSLWAHCLLELNEPEIAMRYYKSAVAIDGCTPEIRSEALNGIAWCLICMGKEENALPYLEDAQQLTDMQLTILLNKAYLFMHKGEFDKRNSVLLEAASLLPYDRRVFSNL
jgi:tetratricopeptide (TPR) repeat protein